MTTHLHWGAKSTRLTMQKTSLWLLGFIAQALCVDAVFAERLVSPLSISIKASSPTCSIANAASQITLPTAVSAFITQQQYLTASGITSSSVSGSGWVTSPGLAQTASISCDTAGVSVTSITVKNSSNAIQGMGTGTQYLVDSSVSSPQKMSGGKIQMGAEQVAVNGTGALFSYFNGAGASQAYTTPFATGALVNGTSVATVVWRPVFSNSGQATALGQPSGGAFKGSYQLEINY